MIERVDFQYTQDITVVNREQFEVHINLYDGYVKKINEIDGILHNNPKREDANAIFSYYRECKRGETYALNGVILHELYFENMGGGGGRNTPNPSVTEQIELGFGSFEKWEEDFKATAKASRGWAVLSYDQRSYRLRNISLDAHDLGNIAYSAPILVLDVYEHAYFLQYTDKKTVYIDRFMEDINWEAVGRRMGIF
jgi:Fe-Mn family superoxide dismutase